MLVDAKKLDPKSKGLAISRKALILLNEDGGRNRD